MTKLQKEARRSDMDFWILGFGISLELGIWDLGF
jgi:hypothetical protein